MKKSLSILLSAVIIIALFAGCSGNDTAGKKTETKTTGVADILTTNASDDFDYFETNITTTTQPATKAKKANVKTKSVSKADVDLTGLNANLVYSQIYDMMTKPDEYIGKSVKISGTFYTYEDPDTGKKYFSCFVADAAACCQQGLEFELTKDYSYPADYPNENELITVSGEFQTYMEGENKYCCLKNAVFTD